MFTPGINQITTKLIFPFSQLGWRNLRPQPALRRWFPWLLGGTLLSLMAIVYSTMAIILIDSSQKTEQHSAYQNLERALDALADDVNSLDATAADYASWDETYNFVARPNERYKTESLRADLLVPLRIDLVILLNRQGQVVLAKSFDSQQSFTVPAALIQYLKTQPQLRQHPSLDSSDQGIVVLPNLPPVILAARPILNSAGEGPHRGTLILGRSLDTTRIQKLSQQTRITIDLFPATSYDSWSELQIARQALRNSMPVNPERRLPQGVGDRIAFNRPLNSEAIASYAVLTDLQKQPALLLRVQTPRVIHQQSLISLKYLLLSLLLTCIIFGGTTRWLVVQLMRYWRERDRIEQELFQEKELAQVTLQSIGDAVITTNARGEVTALNAVAETLTGWTLDGAQGQPLSQIFQVVTPATTEPLPNPVEQLLGSGCDVQSFQGVLVNRHNQEYAIDGSIAAICLQPAQILGTVLTFRDVTQAQAMAQQLLWQASYDSLTGLLNRREFEDRLQQALGMAKAQGHSHILCFLDLDRFKLVNDTSGHAAGDELLRCIGPLLQQQLRQGDMVARFGGDEFAILLYHCSLPQAVKLTQNLIKRLQEFRFNWQEHSFSVGASIGLVAINASTLSGTEAINAADAACYIAKEQGRDRFHVYQSNDAIALHQSGTMQWANEILQALDEQRLELHYQPILNLNSSSGPEHREILLRLRQSNGNLVMPGVFLPAAERYKLMPAVDRWVINTLFSQHLCQSALNPNKLPLYAINLSGATLNDEQFLGFLFDQFSRYFVDPTAVCFEITETVAISNLSRVARLLQELQGLGCRFALDDFGRGMSSFTYLKHLPVDFLKVDGGFIQELEQDTTNRAIVEAINQIGHLMGMQTIAEFVSSQSLLEQVQLLGFDYAQGYYLGHPQPLNSIA